MEVEIDRRRRPAKIGSGAARVTVEVLGSVMGLPRNERGFRVRTSTGSELTVVREPGNTWYADDDLMALTPREPAVAPTAVRDSPDPPREKARP